jgi:prepilin-type N-terminal cleavage/methylation domain-containing protein
MSRISVHSSARRAGRRGFTLAEVMVATALLAVVLAGVLAAYLFVGRNLTRLVNLQQQEVEGRRALRNFTQDVSAAIQLTNATPTNLMLTMPSGAGTTSVTYSYLAAASGGRLVRTQAANSQTLLTGLTSFQITYFNEAGDVVTSSPQSVKAVELVYSSASGSAASGTQARQTTVSPRVLLRNKPALQ